MIEGRLDGWLDGGMDGRKKEKTDVCVDGLKIEGWMD